MLAKGISAEALTKVQPLFDFSGSLADKLQQLRDLLATSEEGTKGVEELTFICETVEELGLKSAKLNLDVTLARGLNYYTGAIFEVAAPETVKLGDRKSTRLNSSHVRISYAVFCLKKKKKKK